jgi:hypothetical protein
MSVTAERVAVTDVATALNTASTGGLTLLVTNGAAAVDLGGSDVVTAEGFNVDAAGTARVALKPGDVLFAVCADTGTSTVQVLRT